MKFTSVAPNSEDVVVIPDGYEQGVVIGWGDPVLPDAPKFDVRNQTAAAQRGQFGFNNDFAALMPIPIDSGGNRTDSCWSPTTSTPARSSCSRATTPTRRPASSTRSSSPRSACPS